MVLVIKSDSVRQKQQEILGTDPINRNRFDFFSGRSKRRREVALSMSQPLRRSGEIRFWGWPLAMGRRISFR
jgi:hypothetical protein